MSLTTLYPIVLLSGIINKCTDDLMMDFPLKALSMEPSGADAGG